MSRSPYVLITGGAGFIGTNLAHRLAQEKRQVVIYDNLSRTGVERNLKWLLKQHPGEIRLVPGDIRNQSLVRDAVAGAEAVFHLAAQVAVTSSLSHPIFDFETNARGTLNILEALRSRRDPPPLIYTSTNKVLGGLEDLDFIESETRYEPADEQILRHGISEARRLDFCSPYGCSKGAADQYVLDYARCFDLPTVVFRMSCIYGPHQCGNEDQGWVAHFLKQALQGLPITFYGDGKQVRDALFADDLVDAFQLAWRRISECSGQAFNIGGGPANTISLIELILLISELRGTPPEVIRSDWRPSDQRYYVSDIRRFSGATGWKPAVGIKEGVSRLYRWLLVDLAAAEVSGLAHQKQEIHEVEARKQSA